MTDNHTLSGNGAGSSPRSSGDLSQVMLSSESKQKVRWSPTRAGLVNVWRYADETFEFHRGRLLLRGPNGAGKSMALELLFPFLLDGRQTPSRLSSASQSRGTLYERVMAGAPVSNRVGFLWAEFTRSIGDDRSEAFTIGVRLRAASSTRQITRDWFTTSQRVGNDLQFLDVTRTPLSAERLRDAIGERGALYGGADDYRDAVRRKLFPGCSEEQYEAVISALLALRTEKLSQNLTPGRLNEILTQSLPPLNEREVAAIAEGFERLDRRREGMERLQTDLREIEVLARQQREYALRVMASVAADVRSAESARDEVTRRAREAREQLDALAKQIQATEDRRVEIRQRLEVGEAEIDALKRHEAYSQGADLDLLRTRAGEAAASVNAQEAMVRRLSDAGDSTQREYDNSTAEAMRTNDAEQHAWLELDATGREIGADAVLAGVRTLDEDEAEAQMRVWIGIRRQAVRQVRAVDAEFDARVVDRARAEQQVEDDRGRLRDIDERRAEVGEALVSAQERFGRELQTWAGQSHFFAAPRFLQGLVAVRDPVDADAFIGDQADAIRLQFAADRARFETRIDELSAGQDALVVERDRLMAGEEAVPDAPSGGATASARWGRRSGG